MRPAGFLATFGLLGAVAPAFAHSPYLLPNRFDATQRDHVSVVGSFTEEFFIPDLAMKATDYHVIGPDGQRRALAPIYGKDLAVIEVDTKQNGSYRISTGLREGSTRKAAQVNGQWEFFAGEDAPANAVDMKAITRADVYVSRGAPAEAVLTQTGKGLELQPLDHPNRLHAGGTLRVKVLQDGKPLARQLVSLHAARDAAGTVPAPVDLHTGADGIVEVKLAQPGVFNVMASNRLLPAAAGQPGLSYTVALTIEVTE